MPTTVLITSAGSGAANNLVRSLKRWNPSLATGGCHHDPFRLRASAADRNWLVLPVGHPRGGAALRAVVADASADLLMPMTDADVGAVAGLRPRLDCRTFLPSAPMLAVCGDKLRLTRHLARHGVAVPETYAIEGLRQVEQVARRLSSHAMLWCRMRHGAGSIGATPVRTADQARHWIDYWVRLRGVPARAFTLAEYLPGRDFACQSLWKDGRLVLIKTVERLSYFGGVSRPSGVSSIAALAKTVTAPAVVDVCERAVRALGRGASGAFSIDLKENAAGVPCITEINAGRFITMLELFDRSGKHSMSATYVRLALGEDVGLRDEYDVGEDFYLIRDVDTLPAVFHATDVFDGLLDARGVAHRRAGRAAKGEHDGRADEEGREEHRASGHHGPALQAGRQVPGAGVEGRGQGVGRPVLHEDQAQIDGQVIGSGLGPPAGPHVLQAPAAPVVGQSVAGEFDGHALEAMWLEARRLAADYGATLREFRAVPAAPPGRVRARGSSRAPRRG